jgi:omega-6 fatty acid desaturase (delta-12 desaturase)
VFQQVKPITLFGSLKSLNFRLWDEASKKLVSFRRIRPLRREKRRTRDK